MIDAPVEALLSVDPAGALVQIAAEVRSAPPRLLSWRLVVDAKGPGGSSVTTQSGVTSGDSPVVRVNANAAGEARLEVRDGERLVAERTAALGPR